MHVAKHVSYAHVAGRILALLSTQSVAQGTAAKISMQCVRDAVTVVSESLMALKQGSALLTRQQSAQLLDGMRRAVEVIMAQVCPRARVDCLLYSRAFIYFSMMIESIDKRCCQRGVKICVFYTHVYMETVACSLGVTRARADAL